MRSNIASFPKFNVHFLVWIADVEGGQNERRLLDDLLSPYQLLERPVPVENETLQVSFGLTLMQIIDVVSQTSPHFSLSVLFPHSKTKQHVQVCIHVCTNKISEKSLNQLCITVSTKKSTWALYFISFHPNHSSSSHHHHHHQYNHANQFPFTIMSL